MNKIITSLAIVVLNWPLFAQNLTVNSVQNISTNIDYSNITVENGGHLTIEAPTIIGVEYLNIHEGGTLTIAENAELDWTTSGSSHINGTLIVEGTFDKTGGMYIYSTAVIEIKLSGVFDVFGGNVTNNGQLTIAPSGQAMITGNYQNASAGTTTINGNFNITGDLQNDNTITGIGLLTVSGTVTNNGDLFTSLLPSPDCNTGCSAISLPVVLSDFYHHLSNNQITATWIIDSEINNDYFEIIGIDVDLNTYRIHTQQGRGTASSQYTYSTVFPLQNLSYQLWQIDFDGKRQLLQSFNPSPNESLLQVFPTVMSSNNEIMIQYENKAFQWTIYSLEGHVVDTQQAFGNTSIQLDNYHLQGLYFIIVNNQSIRFLVQN